MREFKIEANAKSKKRQLQFRLVAWGTVLLLFLVAILIFVLGVTGVLGPGHHPLAGFLFVSTPVLAMVGGGILACREALRLAERQMIFVLDEDRIVRRRRGFPDIVIRFSEMQYIGEELRWLIIKSTAPHRKIGIPNGVCGYEIIRAELAKHHPLEQKQPSNYARSLAGSSLWLVATLISWCLFLWSHEPRIVVPAGGFALISVIVGCVRLWKVLDKSARR